MGLDGGPDLLLRVRFFTEYISSPHLLGPFSCCRYCQVKGLSCGWCKERSPKARFGPFMDQSSEVPPVATNKHKSVRKSRVPDSHFFFSVVLAGNS